METIGGPSSLAECCDSDGSIEDEKYLEYLQFLESTSIQSRKQKLKSSVAKKRKPRKRKTKKHQLEVVDEHGVRTKLVPRISSWYILYVADPQINDDKFQRRFRIRFRVPHNKFLDLVQWVETHPYFDRWTSPDAVGDLPSPVELLVLGVLRYMGRGWTLDDLEEATGIDRETHRQFLHVFLDYGKDVLFPKFVTEPTKTMEYKDFASEYEQAGFHGAVGSMDGTEVIQWSVHYALKNLHTGFKDGNHTTRSYNLICNHRRRILGTTTGHPGSWNDKTLVRFDEFVYKMRTGSTFGNNIFQLYERLPDGSLTKQDYRGAWLLVDNGYINWSITVPPHNATTDRKEIRFAEWLESMRKDVECTFGILKGRWRILKTGVRLRST